MKDYNVMIDYDNMGYIAQYLYVGSSDTMLGAIGDAISSFQEFMKENKIAVEIVAVSAEID